MSEPRGNERSEMQSSKFGAWLDPVRGSTSVVVSEHRPVPLWQYIMAGSTLYDLFATEVAFDAAAPESDSPQDQAAALLQSITVYPPQDGTRRIELRWSF